MNCTQIQPLLVRFVDQELTSDELQQARNHLQHCEACRAKLQALQQETERLASAFAPEALPPPQMAHVERALFSRLVAARKATTRPAFAELLANWHVFAILALTLLAWIGVQQLMPALAAPGLIRGIENEIHGTALWLQLLVAAACPLGLGLLKSISERIQDLLKGVMPICL